MILYHVHIYREMRLYFPGIEAGTPEEAAQIAADKPTDNAEYTDDCEGENLAALIDLADDDEFTHSVTIDFQPERLRKAAGQLLAAIPPLIELVHSLLPSYSQSDNTLDNLPQVIQAREAMAAATAGSTLHAPPTRPSPRAIAVVSLRSGAVQDPRANIPLTVIVEDWDCLDREPPVTDALDAARLSEAEERRLLSQFTINHQPGA